MLNKLSVLTCACMLAMFASSLPAYGQNSLTICKGVSIPDGYTIVKETTSNHCPRGAYVLKKSNTAAAPAPAQKLNAEDLKQVREVLFALDAMEVRLKAAWNSENDFGAATDSDHSYTRGAMNSIQSIATRLDRLPDGDFKIWLMASAVAYGDVGRIRVAASEDNGEQMQRDIVKNYKLENTEPHLWAWHVWEVARAARNRAAKQLGLPERRYEPQ